MVTGHGRDEVKDQGLLQVHWRTGAWHAPHAPRNED
jgi:hypothetical protein